MSDIYLYYGELLIRVLLASVLGGLIGLERDMHGRAAGLRTHLLVSLGASVLTILSEFISQNATTSGLVSDPARIAAQIVSGIGFLGAGVIIKEGANVHGLTTAACLWGVAAIGMAAGSGDYVIAIAATVIALISLILLKHVESYYPKDTYRVLSVRTPIEVSASQVIEIVKSKQVKILNYNLEKDYKMSTSVTKLIILLHHRGIPDKLADGIINSLESSSLPLEEVNWEHL